MARLFELRTGVQNSGAWSGYMISADENGRPFVVPGGSETGDAEMPDISISHSGDRAVAMAADRGRCGVDIQKVTSKVQKVLDRFCSPEEKHILQRWGREIFEDETVLLTMLWAAKESLRKVAAVSPLPGFLELELVEVSSDLSGNGSGPWTFGFRSGKCPKDINCYVAVALVEHYVLALTAIDEAFLQA